MPLQMPKLTWRLGNVDQCPGRTAAKIHAAPKKVLSAIIDQKSIGSFFLDAVLKLPLFRTFPDLRAKIFGTRKTRAKITSMIFASIDSGIVAPRHAPGP